MTPHELGLFLGGAAGALIGISIPIATLRAWFARVDPPARVPSSWPASEVARVAPAFPSHGRVPYHVVSAPTIGTSVRAPEGRPPLRAPEKSPGRPAPLPPMSGEIPRKHAPVAARVPVVAPPMLVEVDTGAAARARAHEVRDAVASLGWPLSRATWATEAALVKLGGGCPELESWVPTALRELAPPSRPVPSLGPVNRRGR